MKFLKQILPFFLFAIIVTFVFQNFIFSNSFGDGDMYYHVSMAEQIRQNGFGASLKNLPLTSLANSFTNHHLGFHLLLLPFLTIFGSLFGAKFLHFLGVAIILTLIYFITHKNIKDKYYSFLVAILPITSILFISRMSIEKATSIAVAYSLLYFWVLLLKNYKLIFATSFLYVYLYGGWPIALIFSGLFTILNWRKSEKFFSNLKPIFYSSFGVLSALIINPNFPQNLKFYYEQIYKIAIVNDNSLGFIASEWLGYEISIFIMYAFVIMLIMAGAGITLYNKKDARTSRNLFIFIISFLFFIATIKSRRYIEYFIPFASLNVIIFWEYLKIKPKYFYRVFIVIFILSFYGIYSQKDLLKPQLQNEIFSYHIYRGAGEWINKNIPTREIIFHLKWEEFPMLWYYAREYKYISGLDARFLLYKNPQFAKEYYSVLSEKKYSKISNLMNEVNSKYLVLNKLEHSFTPDNGFEKHFEDNYTVIYQLK